MTHPEHFCHRCGRPNLLSWHAPSPLWNAVMRADGELHEPFDGIVCPTCFAELAYETGVVVPSLWCLRAEPMPDVPQVFGDGRVWDAEQCMWVDPHIRDGEGPVQSGTGAGAMPSAVADPSPSTLAADQADGWNCRRLGFSADVLGRALG